MEIDGIYGRLDPAEQAATGLPETVVLSELDTMDMLAKLDERTQGLDAKKSADDDELTHAERASIMPDTFQLSHDRNIIETLAGQLMAHQVELSLQNPSD